MAARRTPSGSGPTLSLPLASSAAGAAAASSAAAAGGGSVRRKSSRSSPRAPSSPSAHSSFAPVRAPSGEESLQSAWRVLLEGTTATKYAFGRGGPSERWVQLVDDDAASLAGAPTARASLVWSDPKRHTRNTRKGSVAGTTAAPEPQALPPGSPAAAAAAASSVAESARAAASASTSPPPGASPRSSQGRERSHTLPVPGEKSLLLSDITDIYIGRLTPSFTKSGGSGGSDGSGHSDQLCWSIRAGDRTLDLAMSSPSLRDLWASSVARLLKSMHRHCRVHVSITTAIDATHELSVRAQSTLALASDPTNTTGGVGQLVTPADVQTTIGTITYLEAIVHQKDAEIGALKAATSGSQTPFGVQQRELEEKVRHLQEQLALQTERVTQEARSRVEAQMNLATVLNEKKQLEEAARAHPAAVEQARADGLARGQLQVAGALEAARLSAVSEGAATCQAELAQVRADWQHEKELGASLEEDLAFQERANQQQAEQLSLWKQKAKDCETKADEQLASLRLQLQQSEQHTTDALTRLDAAEVSLAQQTEEIANLRQSTQLYQNSVPADRVNDPALMAALEKLQAQLALVQKELQAERTTNSILGEDLADAEAQLRATEQQQQQATEQIQQLQLLAANGKGAASDKAEADSLRRQLAAMEEELAAVDAELHAKDKEIRELTARSAGMTALTMTTHMAKIDATIIVDSTNPQAATAATPAPSVVRSNSPLISPRRISNAAAVQDASPDTIPTALAATPGGASASASTIEQQAQIIIDLKHELLGREDQLREVKFQLATKEKEVRKEKSAAAAVAEKKKLEARVKTLEKSVDTLESELAATKAAMAATVRELAAANGMLEAERTATLKLATAHADQVEALAHANQTQLAELKAAHEQELAAVAAQVAAAAAASHQPDESSLAHIAELEALVHELEGRLSAGIQASNASHEDALSALQVMHDQEVLVLKDQLAKAEKLQREAASPSAHAGAVAAAIASEVERREKLEKEMNVQRVILSAQIQQHVADEAAMEAMHAELVTALDDLRQCQARESTLRHQVGVVESARSDLAARNLSLSSELSRALILAQEAEVALARLAAEKHQAIQAKKLLEDEADARVEHDLRVQEEKGKREEERAQERARLETERQREKDERLVERKKLEEELSKQMKTNADIASLLTAQTSSFLDLQRVHASCAAANAASVAATVESNGNNEAETALLRLTNAKLVHRIAELEETLLADRARANAAATPADDLSSSGSGSLAPSPTPHAAGESADPGLTTPNTKRPVSRKSGEGSTPEGAVASPAAAASTPTHARKNSGLKLPTFRAASALGSPAGVTSSPAAASATKANKTRASLLPPPKK